MKSEPEPTRLFEGRWRMMGGRETPSILLLRGRGELESRVES
jgi:hypothetical protein